MFHQILHNLYRFIKTAFWRLPPFLRSFLQGPRYILVRWFRGLSFDFPGQKNTRAIGTDLDWPEFREHVLDHRENYKGIFVQEIGYDWNVLLFQRPHHMSIALGRLGYLVIYRTDNWSGDKVNGFREVSENVWLTNRHEIDGIEGVVRSFYSTSHLNRPEALVANGKRGILIYEYIDHIDPEISGDATNIKRLLKLKKFAFEGGVDYVVCSAKRLYDEAMEAVGKDKVLLIPNGVDTMHYRDPSHKKINLEESLTVFKKKHRYIIGYFGALAPWIWYDMIRELVSIRPDCGFVFIGPDYNGAVYQLPKAENLLYLGAVDYKILPAYGNQFDVCFIPFKPGEVARATSPLKLFEYFALEKPVVVTHDMLECLSFKEVFHGDSAHGLSSAIDRAIQVKDDPLYRSRLAQLADENDWSQRAKSLEVVFKGLTPH